MKSAVELEVALRALRRFPRSTADEATEAWIDEAMEDNYWRLLSEERAPAPEAPAQPPASANAA